MLVDRKKFIDMLNATKPALGGTGSTYSFRDGFIRTYNEEMYVEAKMPDPVDGSTDELDCTVSSNDLMAMLRSFRTKEITIEQDEDELILISSKSTVGLRLLEDDTIPFDIEDVEGWDGVPDKFRTALELCIETASDDFARIELCDVSIKEGQMKSTDGYRVTRANIEEMDDFSITKASAKEIVKYEVTNYQVGEKWVFFSMKDGTTVIGCRLTNDSVPDIDGFFESFESNNHFTLPEEINSIVDRMMIVAPKDIDPKAMISIDDNQMDLDIEGNTGWIEEFAQIEYEGEKKEFNVNPKFLKQLHFDKYDCLVSDSLLYIRFNDFTERLIVLYT